MTMPSGNIMPLMAASAAAAACSGVALGSIVGIMLPPKMVKAKISCKIQLMTIITRMASQKVLRGMRPSKDKKV